MAKRPRIAVCTLQISCTTSTGGRPHGSLERPVSLGIVSTDLSMIKTSQEFWIATNFPGSKPNFAQSRFVLSERVLQAIPVELAGGGTSTVYFDVTPEK